MGSVNPQLRVLILFTFSALKIRFAYRFILGIYVPCAGTLILHGSSEQTSSTSASGAALKLSMYPRELQIPQYFAAHPLPANLSISLPTLRQCSPFVIVPPVQYIKHGAWIGHTEKGGGRDCPWREAILTRHKKCTNCRILGRAALGGIIEVLYKSVY